MEALNRASPCTLRDRSMACPLRLTKLMDLVRRLLPTVVFVLGIGSPSAVSAASVSAPTSQEVNDHSQYCKCRNCSKESCCCGPRKSKTTAPRPLRVLGPESPSTASVPCLNSAPCGESGLPSASAAVPSVEAASLSQRSRLLRVTAGRHLPPCPLCILPSRQGSRIDEPPEGPAIA